LKWTSDRTGQVFLRLRHLDGRVAGNAVSYSLAVRQLTETYLPFVNH
jgi:hypothetical protein